MTCNIVPTNPFALGWYLAMDGTGVTTAKDNGDGTVTCTADKGENTKLRIINNPDGTISIASVKFPNVYLRLDGASALRGENLADAGRVNCQYGSWSWEAFKQKKRADGSFNFESVAFPGVYLAVIAVQQPVYNTQTGFDLSKKGPTVATVFPRKGNGDDDLEKFNVINFPDQVTINPGGLPDIQPQQTLIPKDKVTINPGGLPDIQPQKTLVPKGGAATDVSPEDDNDNTDIPA